MWRWWGCDEADLEEIVDVDIRPRPNYPFESF